MSCSFPLQANENKLKQFRTFCKDFNAKRKKYFTNFIFNNSICVQIPAILHMNNINKIIFKNFIKSCSSLEKWWKRQTKQFKAKYVYIADTTNDLWNSTVSSSSEIEQIPKFVW